MARFLLIIFCFLCALLTVLPVPAKQLWYIAIAVTEFPWVWLLIVTGLLLASIKASAYRKISVVLSLIAMLLFASPLIRAYQVAGKLDEQLTLAFGPVNTANLPAAHRDVPFKLSQLITGIGATRLPYRTMQYAVHTGVPLTLNFTPSAVPGVRPCLIVVHGGSWKQGNNSELPDVNSYFAKAGYQVATINYRLAPEYKSPAPQEDVAAAIGYLRNHAAALHIDPNNFVLMGRSAGGQIVLTAAYHLNDPGIKGVISFYGPTDMFWAYAHPDAPLVMDSRRVMADFFGGTPETAPAAYLAGSPALMVTPATVPTLLIHGGNDAHVHFDEATLLAAALQKNGVKHLLLGLPWATHGCEYSLNGPSGQLSVYAAERFLYAITQRK